MIQALRVSPKIRTALPPFPFPTWQHGRFRYVTLLVRPLPLTLSPQQRKRLVRVRGCKQCYSVGKHRHPTSGSSSLAGIQRLDLKTLLKSRASGSLGLGPNAQRLGYEADLLRVLFQGHC